MKNKNQSGKNFPPNSNQHRPEIRDNLDSRVKEEQQIKGTDTTHNKKEYRKPEKNK